MSKRIPKDLEASIGKTFPDFVFSKDLAPQGQNGFSFNFLLNDKNGKTFLLKAIRLNASDKSNFKEEIEEVKASLVVRSQFFIPLLDTRKTNEYVFLLFPFLRGVNLSEHLSRSGGLLSEEEVKDIGINILRGIADLTRHGIRHQDIKPENIFLPEDGGLKILDFGSARFNKQSFKGSTKTNRSHSSPEQILASRPGNLESLRLTCDERSDVYSVGSVLFELLTGKPPFDSNEEKIVRKLPKSIDRTDVSEGLKRIISRLLSSHPRNRPSATIAVSFLETGDVQPIPVNRGGFFYNASTSLKRLQEVYEADNTIVDGLIVEASKLSCSDQEFLRNGPLKSIVDPQVYLFQSPKLINKKFKKLPYFRFGKDGNNIGLEYISDAEGLINSVFDFEVSMGTDILLPPYFLIKEFNDFSWTLDTEIAAKSLEIYQSRNMQLPLFKGVAIAENILLSDVTRGRLIDYLTTTDWLDSISGYFVLIESSSTEGLPSEAWLKAAKEILVALLSTGKVVVWSHACIPSLVFAYSGVGVGMGEAQSQRSFSINEDTAGGIRRASPHLYLPKLFARIKWPSGVKSLHDHGYSGLSGLKCTDSCCLNIDFSNPASRNERDLAIHLIRQLGVQFKKYSGSNGTAKAKKDIESAKKVFNELKTHPNQWVRIAAKNELKPSTGSFLEGWLNAFHGG